MKIYTRESITETLMKKHLKILEEYYFYNETLKQEICTNAINQIVEDLYNLSLPKIELLSETETYIY